MTPGTSDLGWTQSTDLRHEGWTPWWGRWKLHPARCLWRILLSPRSSSPSLSPSALSVLQKIHLCLMAAISLVLFLPFPLSYCSSWHPPWPEKKTWVEGKHRHHSKTCGSRSNRPELCTARPWEALGSAWQDLPSSPGFVLHLLGASGWILISLRASDSLSD